MIRYKGHLYKRVDSESSIVGYLADEVAGEANSLSNASRSIEKLIANARKTASSYPAVKGEIGKAEGLLNTAKKLSNEASQALHKAVNQLNDAKHKLS